MISQFGYRLGTGVTTHQNPVRFLVKEHPWVHVKQKWSVVDDRSRQEARVSRITNVFEFEAQSAPLQEEVVRDRGENLQETAQMDNSMFRILSGSQKPVTHSHLNRG